MEDKIMNLDSLADELDRLYEFEISEYIARCDELKKSGFKIYRNEEGRHKVALTGQRPRKEEVQYTYVEKKQNFFERAKNYVSKRVEKVKNMIRLAKLLNDSHNRDL